MFDTFRRFLEIVRASLAEEKAQGTPTRRQRDEVEFLPAVLEVLETPASPVGRALMVSAQ